MASTPKLETSILARPEEAILQRVIRFCLCMCATIQDRDIARESLDRAYQYSDPERGISYLLQKVVVGSCNEFDYGTGFVSVIGLQSAAVVLK